MRIGGRLGSFVLSIMLLTSLLTPIIVLISPTSPVSADYEPTDHLVVSEVSPTSSPGEWVEIYNPTDHDISLNGCWVDGYGSARDYYFSPTDVIKAHGYFLAPGVWLTDDGVNSYAILKGPGGSIDGVGWGGSTAWKEGSAAPAPGYDHSLERKSGPTHEEGMGNGYDTNNNANDFFVCDSPNPQGSSSPIEPPFVLVSISPDENGGLPETVVTFTVAVKNDRPFEDNFDLEASGFWGWDSVLDDNWLPVGAGETENTTLRVTIPTDAGPGMNDIITVTATSRIMEDTNSDSCIVTAYALLGVKVSISPSSQTGMPGLDQSYSVEVRNFGITTDNYALTVSDELGWGLSLGDNLFTLDPGERDNTSLQVSIPENTLDHVEDIITVTATSQTDNTVSDSDTCTHVCVYEPIRYRAAPTDDQVVMEGKGNLSGSYYEKLPCGKYHEDLSRERSFLKFDISSIPAWAYIENAYFGVYHHYGVYNTGRWCWVEVWTVEEDSWTETVINWSNQPPKVENLYHEYINYTDESPNPWLGTIHSWPGVPVKSYIQNEIADGVASFVLYSPQEDVSPDTDVDFSSKENPYGDYQDPYLEVWYYPCPLPPVGVDVGIDRGPQAGLLGERLEYPVTITNLGTGDDNFDLTVSDTEGWGLGLSEDLLIDVSPDESRAVTLTVTIPMDAESGTIDSITVTATSQENEIVSDNAEAIAAAPEVWVAVSNSDTIKAYGVGVVGAGENIYIINSDTYQSRIFMRYNTVADEWKYLAAPPDNLKNAVAMAWDRGNYVYVLNGASYSTDAFFFYRYDIGGDSWAKLSDTPHTQGAGDAMCWVPGSALGVSDDNYLYAIVGKDSGSKFYRYSVKNSSWSSELNLLWGSTDDGCSLVWTGGSYLYALRGEWEETSPCYDFARYDLINNTWTSMAPIPADPHDGGSGGVGDGGSLLWIGGDYGDYIYALSGNQAVPEPIYDKRFYRYTISANSWERLADLPAGIGNKNGPRLGFASGSTGKIYCWRGCKGDPVLWMYCPMGSVGRGIGVVLEGFNSAYNVDHGGLAPWVWYENTPENAPNPPVMVAGGVGDGTVTAAGIAASCEGSDWQGYTPDNLDVLLDETFKVMAGGTTKKFGPVADAEVTEGNPDSPDSPDYIYNLYNGWNSTYLSERDYFRFDLSEIPLGSTIDSAVLWLNSRYGPSTGEDPYPPTWHLVDAENVSDDSWDESTLTWNTAPPMGPTILDTENFQADDYVGEYKWYSWDVTFYVAGEFANDDQVVSMGLKRRDEGASDSAGWFYSKDNTSYEPYLRVRWTGQVQNVLWYEGYGAYYTSSRCSTLIGALENLGWSVENTDTEPITPSLLEGYNILVIPQLRLGSGSLGGDPGLLPDADVQAIKGFVENGGGLLIMERSDNDDNNYCMVQNKILDALDFGWLFQHDEVQDAENTPGENHKPWLDVIGHHPIGGAYEAATGNDNMYLHAVCSLIPLELGVEISISPEAQSGTRGETLTYTVTVRNTGTVFDSYSLENSDNAGWVLSLDNEFLEVPARENRTSMLRVTVPEDAMVGEDDKVIVTATSQADPTVGDSDSCTAQVLPSWEGVEVSISPDYQENVTGGMLDYTVTVTNKTNVPDNYDNYDLTVSDSEGGSFYLPLIVSEDSYTEGAWYPGSNFNGGCLRVISYSSGQGWTYLKFDLSSIPDDTLSGEAKLQLRLTDKLSQHGSLRAGARKVENDNWTEGELTWNNQPACGALMDTKDVPDAGYQWVEWDVTSFIQEEFAGDKVASICLKPEGYHSGSNVGEFSSKEGSPTHAPRLIIQTRGVPITVPADVSVELPMKVVIPENAVPCTEDNITVTATSRVDENVSDNDSCIAHAVPIIRSVEVSISPEHQENLPSGTLEYTVTVTNTGTVPDNYDLSASDTENWGLMPSVGSLTVPPFGENRTTTLTVNIPENAVGCTEDNITVTAISQTDDMVENSASCIAHVPIVRSVEVSISPGYQENVTGGTLEYTVTVTNTGTVPDTYDLTASDNEGWNPSIASSILVPAFENRTTTLTVTIPENAVPCTWDRDNITVTATSQTDNTVENSASCTAHAIVRGVEVSILPDYQENLLTGTLDYEVTVTNTGNVPDNYDLTAGDNEGWGPTLGVGSLTVPPFGENRTATLTVTIPKNATGCTRDNITVTATSQTDPSVSDNASCIAHAVQPSVEVSISPISQENLPGGKLEYTVTVKNISLALDTYALEASDDQDWTLELADDLLTVPPGENTKVEFLPLADTYVDGQDSPDTPHGESTGLEVTKTADATLLKFDVSSIGSPIKNVALKLYCYEICQFSSKEVDIWGVEDGWEENVTWNSGRPAAETGVLVEDVLEDIPSWWTFQSALLTEYVENQRQGDGIVSLALDFGGADLYASASSFHYGQRYYSKEADGNHPYLEILLPGETTLTVTIPDNATGCTRDNITVTATSQADNTTENSASCIAHAIPIVRGVEVIVEPDGQSGVIGENVVFTVTVRNTGEIWENYQLENNDDAGWTLKLDNDYLEIPKDENRETKLTVFVPDNENLVCTTDNIIVIATAVNNAEVTDNDNATVHAVWLLWSGTAAFELENLYAVRVDKDLQLYTGSKLVVKFYDYGDGYENESVIETFTTPPSWHVEENELARHPEGIGVKKVRLDLTTDNTDNVISTIASYTVRRVDLETRFSRIPSAWFLAPPPERTELETEFSRIPSAWFLAPS